MEMLGPWKLLRLLLRTILWGALAWLILVVLWISLPFPSYERNGADYPTSVLRGGKWLTRVYSHPERFGVDTGFFRGFALDYRIHAQDLSIEISGYEQRLPLISPTSGVPIPEAQLGSSDPIQHFNLTARVGHEDGANLPWFPAPDAVLLFWCIHKDNQGLPLVASWFEQDGLTTLTIRARKHVLNDILEIKFRDKDPKTIVATVPEMPESGSPSMTYPIRVALIFFIAPTAVFINDHFGFVINAIFNSMFIIFAVALYLFLILTIIVSFWRCLGGPSLESTVVYTQERLDRLSRHERLRVMPIDALREALDGFQHRLHDDGNTWMQWFLQICREGWHPERTRALREEAEADLEKNIAAKTSTVVDNTSEPTAEEKNGMMSKELGVETPVSVSEATVNQIALSPETLLGHRTQSLDIAGGVSVVETEAVHGLTQSDARGDPEPQEQKHLSI